MASKSSLNSRYPEDKVGPIRSEFLAPDMDKTEKGTRNKHHVCLNATTNQKYSTSPFLAQYCYSQQYY
jgi:hypothetical protein